MRDLDLVVHGDDGGKVVVAGAVAFDVNGSYPKFLDNFGWDIHTFVAQIASSAKYGKDSSS